MKQKHMYSSNWSTNKTNDIGSMKIYLSKLSLIVRGDQLRIMLNKLRPSKTDTVLDVGLSPSEKLIDTNFFEKRYPYPNNIIGASVEDCSRLKKKYSLNRVVKIIPDSKLPFKDHSIRIVTAWATLEHVGDYKKQEYFINEILRVGQKAFITTPYRGCIYEPHSGFLLIHWFPLIVFRTMCRLFNKDFWSHVDNLNPLFVNDIKAMKLRRRVKIEIYKTFGIIPSHIIITAI